MRYGWFQWTIRRPASMPSVAETGETPDSERLMCRSARNLDRRLKRSSQRNRAWLHECFALFRSASVSPMSRGNVQDGRRRPPSRKGNAINALTADDITHGLYEQQARQRRKIGAAVAALCTVLVTSGTARAAVMIYAAWQIATGSSIAGGRRTADGGRCGRGARCREDRNRWLAAPDGALTHEVRG